MDSVQLQLSFGCLLLGDALGLDHFLTISNSIFLPLASLFLLSLFPDLPCLFSEFFEFGPGFFWSEFGLILLLASDEDFLFEVRIVFMLLDPILCHLDAAIVYLIQTYL